MAGTRELTEQAVLQQTLRPIDFNIEKHRTGILLNPQSGRVKKKLAQIRGLISTLPNVRLIEASDPEEINQALETMVCERIELLVIVGGDGTVQAGLSYLFSNVTVLPMLLIVAGGTTNMTAKDIGIKSGPLKTLKKLYMLLQGQHTATTVPRPVLKISQGLQADIYGMFFASGIIANGAKFFQDHVRKFGITGEIASFIVVMNIAWKLLTGQSSEYITGIDAQIYRPQTPPLDLDCLLLFATTLDRLLFGLEPYWGQAGKPVHFTCIRSEPARFWRSLLAIVFNRGKVLKQADGYFSTNDQELSILLDGNFLVDGEIFHASKDHGELRLSATQAVDFIVL